MINIGYSFMYKVTNNKVLKQASHRMACPSDSVLGVRAVGVWMWIGIPIEIRERLRAWVARTCPDCGSAFRKSVVGLPTYFQQISSLALQLGKIVLILHRLARDLLVVNL